MTDYTFEELAQASAQAAVRVANTGLELYLHDQEWYDERAEDCDAVEEWIEAVHRYVGACETLSEFQVMRDQEQFNLLVEGLDND